MRRIIHISDIHFGRDDIRVVEAVTKKIFELHADLIAVSGDLTQRAKRREFAEAKAFLDQFNIPKVVVPGNHDVPMFDFLHRIFTPYKKYGEFIGLDKEPVFADEEMIVMGINTARSFVVKGGRINEEQVARIKAQMCGLDDKMLKIVVSHHPFDVPEGHTEEDVVGRAKEMMPKIAECGADVFLSGHLHVSSVTNSGHRYRMGSGYNALIIQAGTATSTRGRGEANSFNVLEYEYPVLTLNRYECVVPTEGFKLATTERFTRTGVGWERM